MGERTWPNLLSALLRAEELVGAGHRLGHGRDHGGRAPPRCRSPASRWRCGPRVRRRPSWPAWSTRCWPTPRRCSCPRTIAPRRRRRGRHRRRPGPHGQHLHHGRDRRRRRPASGWSSTATGPPPRRAARPTCWSTSASRWTWVPTGVARTVDRGRHRVLLRGPLPPRHAARGGPAARAGRTHRFNFLGPLTNPARPRAAAVGCFDLRMAPVMAEVFARRGDSALVMRGEDGLDEFTTAAPDPRLGGPGRRGRRRPWWTPPTSACPAATPGDLRGGDVAFNAEVARRMFAGETGPVRDAVLLNAAAAFAAHGGFAGDFTDDDAGRHRAGRRGGRLGRGNGAAGPLGGSGASRRRQPSARAEAMSICDFANAVPTRRCASTATSGRAWQRRNDIRVIPPSGEEEPPVREREMHCAKCQGEMIFEVPPCEDGHDDCPELVCTGCGAPSSSPRSRCVSGCDPRAPGWRPSSAAPPDRATAHREERERPRPVPGRGLSHVVTGISGRPSGGCRSSTRRAGRTAPKITSDQAEGDQPPHPEHQAEAGDRGRPARGRTASSCPG